jgi:hypothetical protein
VQNIRPEDLSAGARFLADTMGITAPSAQAPLYLRLLLRFGGRAVEAAVERLIHFSPARHLCSWRLVQERCNGPPSPGTFGNY